MKPKKIKHRSLEDERGDMICSSAVKAFILIGIMILLVLILSLFQTLQIQK